MSEQDEYLAYQAEQDAYEEAKAEQEAERIESALNRHLEGMGPKSDGLSFRVDSMPTGRYRFRLLRQAVVPPFSHRECVGMCYLNKDEIGNKTDRELLDGMTLFVNVPEDVSRGTLGGLGDD